MSKEGKEAEGRKEEGWKERKELGTGKEGKGEKG